MAEGITYRPAGPRDAGAVLDLLAGLFPTASRAFLHRMLHGSFDPDPPDLGWMMEAGGRPVGFFGLVYKTRCWEGRAERFANIWGYCCLPDFRKDGAHKRLVREAVADPGLNYTGLTCTQRAFDIYRGLGFGWIDEQRVYSFPGTHPHTLLPWPRRIGVDRFEALADPGTAALFREHRGHVLREFLFELGGRPLGLVCRRDYHQKRYPVLTVLHVSDKALFRRHFEAVKLACLREGRAAALSLVPHQVGFRPALSVPVPGLQVYKSTHLPREAFDALYSELLYLA